VGDVHPGAGLGEEGPQLHHASGVSGGDADSFGVGQRLCTLVVGSEAYLPLYGGEAVIFEGRVISRLRSAGYGYTVKKNIGFAYLPLNMDHQAVRLDVDIFGETVGARVVADVLYDPAGKALKS
jgi:4-methylaminobutanoate oxidase (formaldehyde-forming)